MTMLLIILSVILLIIFMIPTRERELEKLFKEQTKPIIDILCSEMTDDEFIELIKLDDNNEKIKLILDILQRIGIERGLIKLD